MLDRLRRKAALVYPIPPAPRTAVLVDWLRSNASVRVFAGWGESARRYAPQAIAGRIDQLIELAAGEQIASLTHAVIALRRESDPWVSEENREVLWQTFRLPLFEQIIGSNGELIAFECEAHDGLHLTKGNGRTDTSRCGCGRTSARLMQERMLAKSAMLSS